MSDDKQNIRYEDLYNQLLERGNLLHSSNKKRIKTGLIFLGVFTVIMIVVRWLTNSDRVVFMLFWIFGMFAIAIYLIGIEYIDDSIQKTLEEVTDRESDFDELMPDSAQMREIVHNRIKEKKSELLQDSMLDRLLEKESEDEL